MGRTVEWRWFAVIGTLLVAQSFVDLTPEGPWNSRSFSRGMVGLAGLSCLYLGWFRWAFKRKGIAPTIDLWETPEQTWKTVFAVGLVFLFSVKFLTLFGLNEYVPEPTGMILTLLGLMTVLNAVYVGLLTVGPLAQSSEEE